MDELTAFERRLATGLDAYVGPPRTVDAAGIAQAATSPTALRGTTGVRFGDVIGPAPRFAWAALAVVGILVVLTAGALFLGGQQRAVLRGLPPVTGPAGNGLLVFARDGDIYVGDPSTGETTTIVGGPEVDSSPSFSPDGTQIAFIRGVRDTPWTAEASIVVARADGSDERVVVRSGFSGGGIGFTWTPDGASLLLNHDTPEGTSYWAGLLSLADASGVGPPRLLTPPLPSWPGSGYFHYTDQVAPMFRPPTGDLILSFSDGSQGNASDRIYAWDADLGSRRPLGQEALGRFEPYNVEPSRLWWSPDGSRFVFPLGGFDDHEGLFMMNAEGSEIRRLGDDKPGPLAWSPDGSEIAFERCYSGPDGDRSVIVIHDVASGAQKTFDATDVATKYEGNITPTSGGNPGGWCGWIDDYGRGRAWDYEGWTWSPDGRSIVLLERQGTHPMVVDVETGRAIDLPWTSDSAPSWQRVAVQ